MFGNADKRGFLLGVRLRNRKLDTLLFLSHSYNAFSNARQYLLVLSQLIRVRQRAFKYLTFLYVSLQRLLR